MHILGVSRVRLGTRLSYTGTVTILIPTGDECVRTIVANPQRKMATPAVSANERRQKALEEYRKKLIEHRELDAKLKKSESS